MAKSNSSKTVIRHIKADSAESKANSTSKTAASTVKKVKSSSSVSAKSVKTAKAKKQPSKNDKKSFILFRPFLALGRYFRDSWRELKHVQWLTRKSAWALTLAVILFSLVIGAFVLACDWLSQWVIQEVIL